nr:immunoglobulin heavy chain junction region [Macaca mulatta]
CARQDSKYDSW